MTWLIKNLGLTLLAASILFSAAAITVHLQNIEDKLDVALKMNTTLSQVAAALPRSLLR